MDKGYENAFEALRAVIEKGDKELEAADGCVVVGRSEDNEEALFMVWNMSPQETLRYLTYVASLVREGLERRDENGGVSLGPRVTH